MKIEFTKRFTKDVSKIKNVKVTQRIETKINEVKEIVLEHEPSNENDIPSIPNMLKM
ncbi:MAG: hypothetical protein AAF806_26800 [Bacteroidota bacterium]